jgi:flavin-dependent dehydrogenase
METKKGKYDLIIVGGGLSASFLCLNILKSNSGFKILVIERNERFPQKVGESFVDITALFVQSLGIDHLLKDQAVKTGVRYLFNETNSDNMDEIAEFASPTKPGRIKGYHVNRQLFDEQMIEEVKSRGVDVFRPAKIISSIHKEFNNLFKVEVDNELHDIESRWVVDASGRNRFIAKKINWKIKTTKLNTGSIMTHIIHNSLPLDWDTPFGDIWNQKAIGSRDFATIHLMRKNAWWWIIRINNTTTSLAVCRTYKRASFSRAIL